MECTSLREERDRLLTELRQLTSPSPHQMEEQTFDDTSTLQQSFTALQVIS